MDERKAGIQCRGMDIRRRKTRSRNSRAQDTEGRRGELRQRRCRTQDDEGRDVRMPSGRNYQEDSRRARDQRTEERKPRNTAQWTKEKPAFNAGEKKKEKPALNAGEWTYEEGKRARETRAHRTPRGGMSGCHPDATTKKIAGERETSEQHEEKTGRRCP